MRRTEREVTESVTLQQIVQDGRTLNLAINDTPAPYVVPVNYGYEYDADYKLHLYIHGAPAGKKRDLIAANPNVSFSIVANAKLFVPEDPQQLSHFSTLYQSVLGTGTATLVDDLKEKEHALRLLLKHETGEDLPGEIKHHDLEYVGVIRVDVEQLTGKQHRE